MSNPFRGILTFFFKLFKGSNHTESNAKDRVLVTRYSRGNVSLQTRNYITKAEKDKLRAKVLSHKFV